MKRKHFIRAIVCVLICASLIGIISISASAAPDPGLPAVRGDLQIRFADLLRENAPGKTLTVGGDTFGVRLFAEGVMITEVSANNSSAKAAGLKKKDLIIKIDENEVHTVADVVNAIEHSNGAPIKMTLRRADRELTLTLTPVKDADGKYRAGIRIRDNAAGIGTVTFIDPRTGAFGGLGHGICDTESGELLPLDRGAVLESEINDVVRGTEGAPGELKGYLCSKKIGTLLRNCECGVFGVLSPIPTGEVMETAGRNLVHNGEATLRCTLGDDEAHDYKVELTNVERDNKGTKCFSVHVTDSDLLARTGGIVQGMSGSPIIQDGKLVGAVTHVLIGDPTRGYGIFLENMLAAMPQELA